MLLLVVRHELTVLDLQIDVLLTLHEEVLRGPKALLGRVEVVAES